MIAICPVLTAARIHTTMAAGSAVLVVLHFVFHVGSWHSRAVGTLLPTILAEAAR